MIGGSNLILIMCVGSLAVNPNDDKALKAYLADMADWIMTTGVGDNVLHNKTISSVNDSIFINGNLARVLLATHKIGLGSPVTNKAYLAEGLKWCDTFVGLQIPINTSTGASGGLWNTGYNQVYIADTGTAIAALALCHSLQPDADKKAGYEDAMEKFKLFVTTGCNTPPDIGSAKTAGVCPPVGKGWVIDGEGPNKGALGDGWYKDELNSEPYTISTATTGSCGFVEYDAVRAAAGKPSEPELAAIAIGAVKWLIRSRTSDGRIPYVITPPTPNDHAVYQPITYSAESFIDVELRYGDRPADTDTHKDSDTVRDVLALLNTTCDWLVANQSADGSWGNFNIHGRAAAVGGSVGFSADGDAQRSPRALSLLQWYHTRIQANSAYQTAIDKYVAFLLQPSNSKAFGVNELALPTGFVGLAVADLIQPWVTFSPVV
jgi:hypothetical protein